MTRWVLVDGWVVPARPWERTLAVAAILGLLLALPFDTSPRPPTTYSHDAAARVAADIALTTNPTLADSAD